MKIDYEYINDLKKVIDSNKEKRICVVGTSCTGKTTYLEYAKNGLDIASKRIESIEDYRDKILEEYQKYETNYQSAKCELTRNFAERRMAQKKNEHNELERDIEAFQNYQRQISILIH